MATESERTLDFNDLDEVLLVLRKNGYSGTNFYELGLFLGLSDITLHGIASDHKGNSRWCLLECLRAWLHKVDKVESKGSSTWTALKDALRKLGENAVANEIERDKIGFIPPSNELRILEKSLSKLRRVIANPSSLALDLLSVDLISDTTLQKIGQTPPLSLDSQIYHILSDLRRTVGKDCSNFYKLLKVFKNIGTQSLSDLAKEMSECCAESRNPTSKSNDDLSKPMTTSVIRERNMQKVITVGQDEQKRYTKMQGKLARLFCKFQEIVETAKVDMKKLKQFIIMCRPHDEVEEELRNAPDVSKIFFIVRTRLCSLVNYSILKDIADNFELPLAFTVLEKYEVEEQIYRKMLLGATFAEELKKENELFSHQLPTVENTIILKLKWPSVKPLVVAEFESIIKDVFYNYSQYIHTLKVQAGSIIVTMNAPVKLIKALVVMAKRKVSYLKEIGVIWLTIGKELIVVDECNDDTRQDQLSMQDITKPTDISIIKKQLVQVKNTQFLKPEEEVDKESEKLFKQDSTDDDKHIDSFEIPLITPTAVVEQQAVSSQSTSDTGDDDQLMRGGGDTATPTINRTWRHYSRTLSIDGMIIGSFGTTTIDTDSVVSHKLVPKELKETDEWMKDEVEQIKEKYQKNPQLYHIQFVYNDLPGEEQSKEYYIKKIKEFLCNSARPAAGIWYTGHGEKDTGNWCFKDGVVTFQDIFDLYNKHCKGKSLTIISDCSYSGQWINQCAKTLDKMSIPSCGHHTREQGILLTIFTSCGSNEEATALTYINEGVYYSEADKGVLHDSNKHLSSGQTPSVIDFRKICCDKPNKESCEVDFSCTWDDTCALLHHRNS